mgnify:CR=1 FL=1
MTYFLTLVSSASPLTENNLSAALRFIDGAGAVTWLERGKAANIQLLKRPDALQMRELREYFTADKIDVFIVPAANRRKKLLIADMDSTMIVGETLDDLAARAGVGERVAAITARAMNGELDFKAALRERVALLKGQPESLLIDQRAAMELMGGAATLVKTMCDAGAPCILVSGGFTFFTEAAATMAGFTHHHGNILDTQGGFLTGTVSDPILDKTAKLDFLNHYVREFGLTPDDVLALGDGANDLPMLQAAGLGIGFHPKPVVAETLDHCILHGDLTAALYAQGFSGIE